MKTNLTLPFMIFLLFQGIALGTADESEGFWKSVRQKRGAYAVKVIEAGRVSYVAVPVDSKMLPLGYVLGVGKKYDSLEKLAADFDGRNEKGLSLFLGTNRVIDNLEQFEVGIFTDKEKKILGIDHQK